MTQDTTSSSSSSGAPRPLHVIALDIRSHWPNIYFGAVPYVDAMRELNTLNDKYYADSAESVVRYFLANANTWRGEHARRIKKELNDMLEEKK